MRDRKVVLEEFNEFSRIAELGGGQEKIDKHGLDVWIQVDGGVSRDTIEIAAEAGADTFVAGSAVYKAEDAYAEVEHLRSLVSGHSH